MNEIIDMILGKTIADEEKKEREKRDKYNAYMREYMRKKRELRKAGKAV